ncbi:FAR1-related sequence 4 [Abeliophyllum distichum]|uniref:FAR1-related sequence 4 n=1 Tax=Abeliophyllum distichum TaxID=126358 RepID=A0ABD1SWB1_9LAMI
MLSKFEILTRDLTSYSEDAAVNMNLLVVDNESLENDVIEMKKCPGLNNDWVEKSNEIVPEVEMKFKDLDEAFEFYKNYASCVDFLVRKRNSKNGDNGLVRIITFTCSRESRRTGNTSTSLKPQTTIKTRCKARLTVVSDVTGSWRITKVHLEHNYKQVLPSLDCISAIDN